MAPGDKLPFTPLRALNPCSWSSPFLKAIVGTLSQVELSFTLSLFRPQPTLTLIPALPTQWACEITLGILLKAVE